MGGWPRDGGAAGLTAGSLVVEAAPVVEPIHAIHHPDGGCTCKRTGQEVQVDTSFLERLRTA